MKRTSFWCVFTLLTLAKTTIQAQCWRDWAAYSRYYFPEKGAWIFPKNIENFKIAHTQIWSNNQWRDTTQFTNSFNINGLMQSSASDVYKNGQWTNEATAFYTYNGTNDLMQIQIGGPPTFLPLSRLTHTLGVGGRIEKILYEDLNLGTGNWQGQRLDSNVYALSGRQSFYYRVEYNRLNQIRQTDSLTYDATGRIIKIFVDDYSRFFWGLGDGRGRYMQTYNIAGKMTEVLYHVPQRDMNGNVNLPIVWDVLEQKATYFYNAQNQLVEVNFEGVDISNNQTTSIVRYRFTVDANGKVLEDLKDEFNRVTQTWVNTSKTVYTYYRIGTEEIVSNDILIVAPNPTHDGSFQIQLQDAGYSIELVELYNLYGSLILTQKNDNQKTTYLNFINLINGQYLLKVKTNKGWIVKKLCVLN
jgi:Secretion system C-terminal sorting domain